jgi:hypothetical protein
MQSTASFLVCLFAALCAAGVVAWLLARAKIRRDLRRIRADQLVTALQRYSAWFWQQRLASASDGGDSQAAEALADAHALRRASFPELAGELAELLAVHRRLVAFLQAQHALWLSDPQHWLPSRHDQRFMALWREHRAALQLLLVRIERLTRVGIFFHPFTPARRQSTYA